MPDIKGSYIVKKLSTQNVIKYNLKVIDYITGDPMYGAIAGIKINNKYIQNVEVNSEGFAYLVIKKRDLPCKLEIRYIGYYNFEYTIDDTLSRDIEIKLIQDKYPFEVSFYSKNDMLKFDVRQVTNNSFHLKSQDENDFQDWLLFNKTGEYNDK